MRPDVVVRQLRADDVIAFKALRLAALQTEAEYIGSTFELEKNVDMTPWLGEAHVLGALRDGDLVGTAGLSFLNGTKQHIGRLWGVYVRRDLRRRGVARLLLNALLGVARSRIELVQLTVVSGNESARRLYESTGFDVFGVQPKAFKLDDRYLAEVHMLIDLDRNGQASASS
ncbi:N-acetyltransferase family protein [Bradyrhizobium sp. HKCCYLS3077]|uniref:GNAT family N-acetyltransferase n=1 Tax=Bradyrhizobium sp. HKCCYLS3077 TaxID=3420761 RepID=UPI003EB8CAF8